MIKIRKFQITTLIIVFLVGLLLSIKPLLADSKVQLSNGQTVYVALYSNVFLGVKDAPFNLTGTLSMRNTDPNAGLQILSAKYFDNDGKLLKEFIKEPISLSPVASHHITIKESDTSGGFGANFIVKWKSAKAINPPMIQSVMIGGRSGQGVSFTSDGRVIKE